MGCAPGLAEDPAPTLSHWRSSLCRDFYRARSHRTYRRQTAADTEPHVAPGLDRAYCDGWLTGACVTDSGPQGALLGTVLGAIGGVVGCFAGYHARTRLVKGLGTRDIYVALFEDLVAVGGCLWVVSRF